MSKTYKVRFYREADDNYNELWEVISPEKPDFYLARNIYHAKGRWYYVSDPMGYCELDYPLHDDDEVIVCAEDGSKLFRSRNGDESVDFNDIETEARARFSAFDAVHHTGVLRENNHANFMAHCLTGTPAGSLNSWLLSFKDPDLYGDKALGYDENWIDGWCGDSKPELERSEPETLESFKYLGREWTIECVTCRHLVCGAEWTEYYSMNHYIGAAFDASKVGTMYTAREAHALLVNAIRVNFPNNLHVRYVKEDTVYGTNELVRKSISVDFYEAADILLRKDDPSGRPNLHRAHVDALVDAEAAKSSFFENATAVRVLYPDCVNLF